MKRLTLVAIGLIATPSVLASEWLAEVGLGSNYVWRGETRTDDEAVVFGGIRYLADAGVHGGLRTFNINTETGGAEQEIDTWLGYRFAVGEATVDVGVLSYHFPRGDQVDLNTGSQVPGTDNQQDFFEGYATVESGGLRLALFHSDDYFGSDETGQYAAIDYRYSLAGTLALTAHYGMKWSRAIPDHANRVSDFAIGLVKDEFRLELTNLDDNEDARQSDNARLSVSWRHLISL